MKKIIYLLICLFSLSTSLAQQKTIVDPNASLRNLNGKSFSKIEVSNAIKLIISQGAEQSIAVSANEEIYKDDIVTEVEGNTLKIFSKNKNVLSNRRNKKLTVYVSFTKLEEIEASGATDVVALDVVDLSSLKLEVSGASTFKAKLKVNYLNIELSGASNAMLYGIAIDAKIECNGASDLNAYGLSIDKANLDASGASSIHLTVMKEMSVEASGASSVNYKGTVGIKNIKTSGASSVSKAD